MPKDRFAPDIGLAPIPEKYGRLCVHNFDWWEESLNMDYPESFWTYLKGEKAKAIELDDTRNTPIKVEVGETPFQLLAVGAKGGREFVLENNNFRIEIASRNKNWGIKWRGKSAAIWALGVEDLRDAIYDIFRKIGCTPKDKNDYIRLTRVDYCFDIHSPRFTGEMFPRIGTQTVCPRENKVRGDWVVQADRIETLTIGMASPCQVQIYDKTKEITEASNKTWLYDLWSIHHDTGEIVPDSQIQDVWRVEIRLKKDWLKSRKVNRPDVFLEHLWRCLSDVLYNRRLTVRTKDSNRRRWPLHPMYGIILNEIDNPTQFLSIDRRATGRKSELRKIMLRNLAGTARSLAVLLNKDEGDFKEGDVQELLIEAFHWMMNDEDHREKVRRALEKYEFVDMAR